MERVALGATSLPEVMSVVRVLLRKRKRRHFMHTPRGALQHGDLDKIVDHVTAYERTQRARQNSTDYLFAGLPFFWVLDEHVESTLKQRNF